MVSSHGRILSSSSPKHQYIWRGYCTPAGYYSLRKGSRAFLVHRLVAGAFLGAPPSTKCLVNHRDSNRGNNHVKNLEYVTPSQNALHACLQRDGQMRKTRNGESCRDPLRGTHDEWLQFGSIRAAAVHTGTKEWLVSDICNEKQTCGQSSKWDFVLLGRSHSRERSGVRWC